MPFADTNSFIDSQKYLLFMLVMQMQRTSFPEICNYKGDKDAKIETKGRITIRIAWCG